MPSRSLNRRRFDVAADGHTGNCGRVAVFNGCNAALGQTGTFGQKQTLEVFPPVTASGCLQSLNSRLPMTANAHGSHWSATSTKVRSKPRSSHWTDMYFE